MKGAPRRGQPPIARDANPGGGRAWSTLVEVGRGGQTFVRIGPDSSDSSSRGAVRFALVGRGCPRLADVRPICPAGTPPPWTNRTNPRKGLGDAVAGGESVIPPRFGF